MIPLQEIKPVPLEPGHHCSVLRLAGGAVDGHIPGDVQLDGEPGMHSVKGKFRAEIITLYVLISRFIFFNQTQIQDPAKLDL